jgi:hypothetical protein
MGRILSRILERKTFGLYDAYSNSIPFSFIINHKTWQNHPIATIMFLNTKYRTDEEIMDDFALG